MIRNFSLRRKRLSNLKMLRKQIIECGIWVSMMCRVRDSLRQREPFKGILKSVILEKVERSLQCEHGLIVISIKISPYDEPIYRRDFRSNKIADVRHQLIDSYFTLPN